MNIISQTHRAEIAQMIERYEAAVKAGQKISEEFHHFARAAKYVVAIEDGGTDVSLHSLPAKQVVELFARIVA